MLSQPDLGLHHLARVVHGAASPLVFVPCGSGVECARISGTFPSNALTKRQFSNLDCCAILLTRTNTSALGGPSLVTSVRSSSPILYCDQFETRFETCRGDGHLVRHCHVSVDGDHTIHQSFEPGDALLSHPKDLAEYYSVEVKWRLTSSTYSSTAACTPTPATSWLGQQLQPTLLPDTSSTRVRDAWAPVGDPGPAALTSDDATHTRPGGAKSGSRPGSGRGRAGLDELQGIVQECSHLSLLS